MKVTASAFKGRTEPGAKEQELYSVVHLMTWQRGSWEEEKLGRAWEEAQDLAYPWWKRVRDGHLRHRSWPSFTFTPIGAQLGLPPRINSLKYLSKLTTSLLKASLSSQPTHHRRISYLAFWFPWQCPEVKEISSHFSQADQAWSLITVLRRMYFATSAPK